MTLLYEYRVFLFSGFTMTLLLSLAVVLGGTVSAIVLVTGMMSDNRLLRKMSFTLVELLRDVPLMVNVLMVYFMLPSTGISLSPFWSCSLSISIWGGANGAHILRAGLMSVNKGQRETALAFNFNPVRSMFLIILPQAMPVILPPYISLITALVQATSLGAIIGATELLRSGQVIIEQTTIMQGGSPAYLIYGSILVVYFLLCWLISQLGGCLEKHFLKPYRREDQKAALEARIREIKTTVPTNA
jgi:polar amino acid transport system permease protein